MSNIVLEQTMVAESRFKGLLIAIKLSQSDCSYLQMQVRTLDCMSKIAGSLILYLTFHSHHKIHFVVP